MARMDKAAKHGCTSVGDQNNPCVGIFYVESHSSYFSFFAADNAGTTVYLWPDTSNKWRYGTTEPTVATQDTAGTAIGS